MNTITLSKKSMYNKISAISFPEVNWKLFYTIGILLFSLVLVFYIYLVNDLTKGVYSIKNYNKEINNLLQENKILSSNLTNNNFLLKTQEKATQLSFEKTKDIKYIQIIESPLVQR